MKIIGSDFDGTITTNNIVLDETRRLIHKFRKEGNQFIIVTGRSPEVFKDGITKHNIDFFDYVICANGAAIFDENLNCIKKTCIPLTTVYKILEQLFSEKEYESITMNTLYESIEITSLEDLKDIEHDILSIALTFPSEESRKKYDINRFDHVSVFANYIFMDILSAKISKASEILYLYDFLHGDKLYTIGDGENDICMLQCCKNSYTFEKVNQDVKTNANFILKDINEVLKNIIEDIE